MSAEGTWNTPDRPDASDPESFDDWLELARVARERREARQRRRGGLIFVALAMLVLPFILAGARTWIGYSVGEGGSGTEPTRTAVTASPSPTSITQERLDEAAASQFSLLLAPNMEAANQALEVLRAAYPQCVFYAVSENVKTRGEALAHAESAVHRLRKTLGEDGEDVLISANFARAPDGTIYWAALAADC